MSCLCFNSFCFCHCCCHLKILISFSPNLQTNSNVFFCVQKMFYFPLTPSLLAYMRSPTLSLLMTFHQDHHSVDGIMRIPSDTPAWKHLEASYEQMKDARLVMLQVCMDGMNLARRFSSSNSFWAITCNILNLHPRLAIHKSHI